MSLDMSGLGRRVPPIEIRSVFEAADIRRGDPRRGDVKIGVILLVVGCQVSLIPERIAHAAQELIAVQGFEPMGRGLDRVRGRIGNYGFARLARSGHRGNQNHAIGRARTVNRGRTGIFQHVDRLDVRGVQVHKIALVDDSVDHQQRCRIASIEGVLPPHGDTRIGAGRGHLPHVQTRNGTLQGLCNGNVGRLAEGFDVGRYNRSRQV